MSDFQEHIHVPIDGTLDLHTFRPSEIGSLIPEYLRECRRKNIFHVRIIHGKGSGNLRRGVHGVLEKCPEVTKYTLADEKGGSWGATLVELKR
ncbi:MAG TPA: Smr/MutS family protein [Desulfopila sp.]|nr:Smr/MutS family protein [Desulfopila sp.]